MKLQRLFVNEPRANLLQKIPQNVVFCPRIRLVPRDSTMERISAIIHSNC